MQQESRRINLRHWVYIFAGAIVLVSAALLVRSCVQQHREQQAHILHAGVDCSNGYAAELARQMAKEWGDSLELTVCPSIDSLLLLLDQGDIDIITQPQPRTEALVQGYSCSDSVYTSRMMLVRNEQMPPLANPSEMRAKTISIAPSPAVRLRLNHLMLEMADTIFVDAHEDWSVRKLLQALDSGMVSYAVVNHRQYLRAQEGLKHIREDIPVGFYQEYVFVMHKNADIAKINRLNKFVHSLQ